MLKRGKIVIVLLFVIVLNISLASAANETINDDAAFSWLYGRMNSTGWQGSTSEIAISVLALNSKGYNVTGGLKKLNETMSGGNWNNGNIKDTSLAILALHKNKFNVSSSIEWLEDQEKPALDTGGTWYIQLDTNSNKNVTCSLTYEDSSYVFSLDGNEVIQTEPSNRCTEPNNWINFLTCVKGDYNIGINEEVKVSCTDQKTTSAVLFETESGSTYYVVDEGDPLNIENGCFENQGSCDCEATGYASWVLREVGSEPATEPYLLGNCQESRGYSFLYMLTLDTLYSNWLEQNQLDDGSWETKLDNTYLAVLALHKVGKKSGAYLDKSKNFFFVYQRKQDGSWNQDIEDTAFILYSLYGSDPTGGSSGGSGGTSVRCGDGIIEGSEECEGTDLDSKTCKLLGFTGGDLTCNTNTCKFDKTACITTPDEDVLPPPLTCLDDEEYDPVNEVCVKKTSFWKWIIIGLIAILGVGLIYLLVKKYIRKKPVKKQPFATQSSSPFRMTRQNMPMRRPVQRNYGDARREEKIEKELEDSIKRARDILKK